MYDGQDILMIRKTGRLIDGKYDDEIDNAYGLKREIRKMGIKK